MAASTGHFHGLVRGGAAALPGVILALSVAVPLIATGYAAIEFAGLPAAERSPWLAIERWGILLWNTAIVCGVAVTAAVPLGTALGVLISRTDMPGRGGLAALAALGVCVPTYASLVFVFVGVASWTLTGSAAACGAIHGLLNLPLVTLFMSAALSRPAAELEDDARLSAGPWRVLTRVTLPNAAWGMAAAALIVVVLVMTDYSVSDLLVVRTFAEEVYTQFALDRSRCVPVVAGLPVLAALMLIFALARRALGRFGDWTEPSTQKTPRRYALGRARLPLAGLILALLLGGVAFIAINLWPHIGSLERLLLAVKAMRRELRGSLLLAAAGAAICVAAGAGLAWSVVRRARFRGGIVAGLAILLATPAPIAGVSLLVLFNRPGILGAVCDSAAVIVIGYVVRFLPVAAWLMIPAAQRIAREFEDAARVDGCDGLGVQRHVYWPAAAREAAAAWLVLAVLCFGEIGCTMLVAPPAWTTASVRAYGLLHFGVYADLAALALASTACIILPWIGLLLLFRKPLRA